MGPARKSRSVSKRFSFANEVSPAKYGENTNKKNECKKLSDMQGPHWRKEELEHFYEAYRKHGRDWRKVAAVIRNRSAEMVEAVYSLNKAYLSLPEGTASVAGFIAMMTDYYSNMLPGALFGLWLLKTDQQLVSEMDGFPAEEVHQHFLRSIFWEAFPHHFLLHYHFCPKLQNEERDTEQERIRNYGVGTSQKPRKRVQPKVQETTSDFGCLSLLKKKRSGGSRPRVVGKRTPRFPVSHSHENFKGEKPTRRGLKLKAENDEDVAHSIAMTLTEASKRDGSPQVSQTQNSLMTSRCHSAEKMYDESDVASGWFVDNGMYDDDIEGSIEADNTDFSRGKSKERINSGYTLHDWKGSQGRKVRVDKKEKKHLYYVREACSGTEGQNLGSLQRTFDVDVDVANPKPSRSSQASKKRSKEASTARDENSAFDALETLANLSLMILPDANGNGKDKLVDDSHLLLNSSSRQSDKRQKIVVPKNLVNDTNAASEPKDSHQLITKVSRKRQKIVAPKISKAEASINTTPKESLEAEATHTAQMSLSRPISQSFSPQLVKYGQQVSSSIHTREVHRSALSHVHVSEMNPSNVRTKVRNKRKMYKPESTVHRRDNLKGEISNCLSNQLMRRWCAFEWFYSAIDDPWFAKREFVEYLYHVGLGHVPRLTRVEWGVIRSSLVKPRRFSDQFLKEEKEKLNQYRDFVRTHYSELRSGSRDGLPADLARPLAVGQRVVAVYPRTREIHDGTILTVDHHMCRVQFDRPVLGAEIIMDTHCMPLNPFENSPASLIRRTPIEKFFESLNEVKVNGWGKDQRLEDYTKGSSRETFENMDEVALVKSELQSRNGPRDTPSNHHAAYFVAGTHGQVQAKEADVEAIAELTRALDKKEAVVFELKRMNDDVLENQTEGDFSLQDSDTFKKQYAAILVQLNEVNAQVSSALFRLRHRNTYERNFHLNWPKAVGDLSDHGGNDISDHASNHTQDSDFHVNEIVEISRTKARTMVDIAIQAMSSLKLNPTVEIDKAVDYVNDRLLLDDSYIPPARPNPILHSSYEQPVFSIVNVPNSKKMNPSDLNKASVPSELITQCVSTLFIIQKCTERQFPPAEVASILDSAVSSLQPCSPQNLQLYAEIQKCMGIIKNQILALVPT